MSGLDALDRALGRCNGLEPLSSIVDSLEQPHRASTVETIEELLDCGALLDQNLRAGELFLQLHVVTGAPFEIRWFHDDMACRSSPISEIDALDEGFAQCFPDPNVAMSFLSMGGTYLVISADAGSKRRRIG